MTIDPPDIRIASNGALPPSEDRLDELGRRALGLERLQANTSELGARVYELAIVSDLHDAMASVLSVQELLDTVIERCTLMANAGEGSVFLLDPSTGDLVLRAARGRLAKDIHGIRRRPGEGVAGYVAERLEPIISDDIAHDERFDARVSERYKSGSFMSVPIMNEDGLVGVISVSGRDEADPFAESDLANLLLAARYSAVALGDMKAPDAGDGIGRRLHEQLDAAIGKLNATNRELARLRESSQAVFQSIPLGMIAFDASFRTLVCNSRARELFGIDDEDEIECRMKELDLRQPGRQWAEELAGMLEGGGEVRFDEAILRAGGGERPRTVRVIASPLRDADGKMSGGVIVIDDITDRIKLERELAANEHHAVLGRLAARVAHEVNNPLDGILRYVNLAMDGEIKNPKVREYLEDCRTGLRRMAGIVSSLLDFSRKRPAVHRDVGLNEAINEAVGLMRPRGQALGIELTVALAENIPSMACGEIVQVMMNLIKNAFDAMPSGGSVEITSSVRDDHVEILVADTGEGMSEKVMRRMFDPFFTTKPPAKGTGLGLAICHDIVEKFGGVIGAESEPGVGTTFRIAIPCA